MCTLTFNDNERALLQELLEIQLKELPHEIHYTDHSDFRESLKKRKDTLEQLLKKFQESLVPSR